MSGMISDCWSVFLSSICSYYFINLCLMMSMIAIVRTPMVDYGQTCVYLSACLPAWIFWRCYNSAIEYTLSGRHGYYQKSSSEVHLNPRNITFNLFQLWTLTQSVWDRMANWAHPLSKPLRRKKVSSPPAEDWTAINAGKQWHPMSLQKFRSPS